MPHKVNFDQSIWQPLLRHKVAFGFDIFSEAVQSVFSSLTPVILAYAITNQSYIVMLGYGLTYVALEILNRYMLRVRAIYTSILETSLSLEAYKFFLTVDPIHHTYKSSGQILSKIGAGCRSYINAVQFFTANLLPTVTSLATIIFALLSYNFSLGLVAALTFGSIVAGNIIMSFVNSYALIKPRMKAREAKSAVSVESLQQNALIRSSFATTEQIKKLEAKSKKFGVIMAAAWWGNGLVITLSRLAVVSCTVFLSLSIIQMNLRNQIDAATGLALVVAFVHSTGAVTRAGNAIRDFTEAYADVTDLYSFIRKFGQQTYPVLADNDSFKPAN